MLMKLLSPTAVFIATVLCTGTALAADSANVDLTSVFMGMEKNCASSNAKFEAATGWLSTQSGKAPALAKAGTEMRAAVGKEPVKVLDEGDFWTLSVMTPHASYRGAALVGIERWIGKDNGINGISLLFADTPAAVAKAIGKIPPTSGSEEHTVPQLLPGKGKGKAKAVLMCDFST